MLMISYIKVDADYLLSVAHFKIRPSEVIILKLHELWRKVWDRSINNFSVEPANTREFEEFFNIFSI